MNHDNQYLVRNVHLSKDVESALRCNTFQRKIRLSNASATWSSRAKLPKPYKPLVIAPQAVLAARVFKDFDSRMDAVEPIADSCACTNFKHGLPMVSGP